MFDEALRVMGVLGATIVESATYSKWNLGIPKQHWEIWMLAQRIELKKSEPLSSSRFYCSRSEPLTPFLLGVEKFLTSAVTNPHNLHTLQDVLRYTQATPEEEFEAYGAANLEKAEASGREFVDDPSHLGYHKSSKLRLEFSTEISRLLDKYDCDILVAPTGTETTAAIGGNPQVAVPLPACPDGWPIRRRPDGQISNTAGIP